MLELKKIKKTFNINNVNNIILNEIDLKLDEKISTGIMGKSGSGKSTLIRILLRLITPDSGTVLFHGEDITKKKNNDLKEYRRQVQLISQRPQSFFDPSITIGSSIKETLINLDKFENFQSYQFEELLKELKLRKDLLSRYPHQISGGEIQRFSLFRSLLLEPSYLVLDESTSMLDISVQAQILKLLKDIRKNRSIGYLIISHDKKVVQYMCDEAYYLENGKLGKML